ARRGVGGGLPLGPPAPCSWGPSPQRRPWWTRRSRGQLRGFGRDRLEQGAHLRGVAVAVAGDEPGGVVLRPEGLQRRPELLDAVVGLDPQQLLLEGADEPLCDPVALGRCDEARAGDRPEERELVLERVAHVL